jgi:hypothetical protein
MSQLSENTAITMVTEGGFSRSRRYYERLKTNMASWHHWPEHTRLPVGIFIWDQSVTVVSTCIFCLKEKSIVHFDPERMHFNVWNHVMYTCYNTSSAYLLLNLACLQSTCQSMRRRGQLDSPCRPQVTGYYLKTFILFSDAGPGINADDNDNTVTGCLTSDNCWIKYNFNAPTAWNDCAGGAQYVKRSHYANGMFLGVQLCSATR